MISSWERNERDPSGATKECENYSDVVQYLLGIISGEGIYLEEGLLGDSFLCIE